MQLSMDHPNFNISDLVLDSIHWKKQGCGFSMLRLVFRKGIMSPLFAANDVDAEDFLTTVIKKGHGDRVA